MSYLNNKKILITGACGTVGSELIKALLTQNDYSPTSVIGLDNNESELFFLDQKYQDDNRICFYLADLRDKDALKQKMENVDIVFHTAALKHVVLCERSPMEAVQTNIDGVQNLIEAAFHNSVEKVIFTSSDKAVNPTNVMGTTKLMGERLITAANSNKSTGGPIFSSTRFGNVLGSNGSVIPIFQKQISAGGPVTLTSPEMTRFVMSIDQAAKLVLDSCEIAKGGEVFITKMPIIKIKDLAEVMIECLATDYGYTPSDIAITEIGSKPGEKLYEELMSDEETRRSLELKKFFSVMPAFRGFYNSIDYSYEDLINDEVDNPYNSSLETSLTKLELKEFLYANELLNKPVSESGPSKRYWPGDKESSLDY